MYCGDLKVNSTTTISVGPALDDDDALTEKTGLTIEDTDVYLSKNGGAKANPNDTNDCTEDANGIYLKQLNATDLGTEGLLTVYIHFTDVLYIRQDYTVLSEAAYEAKYTAKDAGYVDVHVKTIEAGIIANASFNADVGSTAHGSNIIALACRKILEELNLDHLLKITVSNRDTMPEIVDDTILANILTKTDGDTSDFDHATDSLEALRDHIGDGTNLTEAGGDGDHLTEAGGDGDHLTKVGITQGAADLVWGTAARVLTAGTNLNDVSTAEVETAVDAAFENAIPATPTADSINDYIQRLKWTLVNQIEITEANGNTTVRKDDDATAAATVAAAFDSDGTTTTRKRLE